MATKLEDIHAQALADAKARTVRFFLRHGISEAEVEDAQEAHDQFCKDEERHGKHFYCSPLGFKAFAVGYVLGKRRGKLK